MTPVVSYVFLALMILVYLYQMMIGVGGDHHEEVYFTLEHGLVPCAIRKGQTEYTFTLPTEKTAKERSSPKMKAEENRIPKKGESPLSFDVKNTWLGVILMPLTYIFLHAGWMHLIGNIWFFWIFSDNVEERLGSLLYLGFFLLAGAVGGFLHIALNSDSYVPLVGASGAISGLMGAYVMMFPGNRITSYFTPVWFFIRRIDVPAWMVLGFYLLFNTFALAKTGVMATGVAFDCHLGGFAAGLCTGFFFRRSQ